MGRNKRHLAGLDGEAQLSLQEVGTLLGVSRSAISKAVKRERIAFSRIGPFPIVLKKEAVRYGEARKRKTTF